MALLRVAINCWESCCQALLKEWLSTTRARRSADRVAVNSAQRAFFAGSGRGESFFVEAGMFWRGEAYRRCLELS